MTYLQLVNAVLARLRENEVSSVAASPYATLIGHFVNEAKHQVENAWKWDSLRVELSGTTTPGQSLYIVTGSGLVHRDATVIDSTNGSELRNVPLQWIRSHQVMSAEAHGIPQYYAWNGNNGTDSAIELYPTPSGEYSIEVMLYANQPNLVADDDELLIKPEAVIAGAYARALVERGEDGGLGSAEAYGLFKGILSDQIALEASRQVENNCWVAV